MSRTQRRMTDALFALGLLTAFLWCGAQAKRALTTTEGVSLAQYVAFAFGFLVQLVLALEARRQASGRIITQQIWLFTAWSICGSLLIATVVTRGHYHWSYTDTVISVIAGSGILITIVWATLAHRPFDDAAVRAWTNISLKSLPQFLLVAKVLGEGSGGITTIAIILGNVSILTRLIPISVSLATEGHDRERKWLWVSDAVNLASWLSVTVVWLIKL